MDAAAEIGRNSIRFSLSVEYEQADAGWNPSFSGANGDREMFVFPVQLTTSRIGNLTRLIYTLLYVMTIPQKEGGLKILCDLPPV